jgi:predicted NUDIX family NTP pyrophosphohydrolase
MPQISSGLLLYRVRRDQVEVFLVHPGGPFWAKKDAGAWSIPKGVVNEGEDLLVAAQREFTEETGFTVAGKFIALGSIKATSAKTLHVWAVEGEAEAEKLVSNTFTMEWPPRSGKSAEFPEVDRAGWFAIEIAAEKIHQGQAPLLGRLREALQGLA